MGMLDDAMKEDAWIAFGDTDAFGEVVTYTPVGGSGRAINAVVDRRTPEIIGGDLSANSVEVFVSHSSDVSIGVDSVSINDAVTFARQPGGSSITMRVCEVIDQDNGMWRLRLQ